MEVRERDRNDVEREAQEMLALRGRVLGHESAGELQQTADGEPQQKKHESCEDHRRSVESDREGFRVLLDDVGGEEGQQRGAEEVAEVGVEHTVIALLQAMDQVMVVDPVDGREAEGEQVNE